MQQMRLRIRIIILLPLYTLSVLLACLNKGIIPSSHSVRFRILEKDYPILYKKADSDFGFYQRSYRERLNKETCEVLKDDVEGLFKDLNIEI